MSLEATIIVLDNSHYSLNGDYAPTRLEAQSDAVHVLFNSKVRANPENEVGLMVMAGKGPEVLTTLTQDEGKLIAAMHEIKRGGQVDLQTGIQVAQLALKHRQNKNQRQRIIAFVGSPIKDSQASLVKLGKKLKKNNVALDIVSFGTSSDSASAELDLSIPSLSAPTPSTSTSTLTDPSATSETNETKLQALIGACSSSDNSHFLQVDPGPHLLSEKIMQSSIVRGEGGGDDEDMGTGSGGGGGGGGGEADEFGVDPNLDPELAMALRMSLQEEQARQAAASSSSSAAAAPPPAPPSTTTSSTSAAAQSEPVPEGVNTQITDPTGGSAIPTNPNEGVKVEDVDIGEDEMLQGGDDEDLDEDEELRRALLLSQGADDDDVDMLAEGGEGAEGDEDEDEDIARAIALSMQDAENQRQEDEAKK